MTAQFASKFNPASPLLTPEPHYIPGYGGFCPQYKYHLGRSYGKLTSKLLSDPKIPHSQQLVLQSLRYPVTEEEKKAEPPGALLKDQRHHWREELFAGSMIPGYTGFIPRTQHHFAKTYAQVSQDALNDFMNQQHKVTSREEELAFLRTLQAGTTEQSKEEEKKLPNAKYRIQLPPVTKEVASPNAFYEDISPYSMEDNNPHKYFMPGFTGYIPRARFLFGAGYSVTTNRALVEFGQKIWKRNKASGRAQETGKGDHSLPDVCRIYPNDLGLLPQYTGYVPGYKFQYGKTYGQLTRNVLGLNAAQKEVAASM
ncbi:ciliary microtubule inner protein 2B [Microcaecilia unicolor]|uniref:Ciliary microtubule inner protein 2B n=1 Tax=Microcaecilia unicolor TaxID=1415580 RepID=A0A6P7XC53_9AMPH|nr:protein FAM166B [Microcaecilia unicolor]